MSDQQPHQQQHPQQGQQYYASQQQQQDQYHAQGQQQPQYYAQGQHQSHYAAPQEPPKGRFEDAWKWLPVGFVACNIIFLYIVFCFYHCVPLLQLDVDAQFQDQNARDRGFAQIIALHVVTLLLILCYIRSILTHPGTIPDNDPKWLKTAAEEQQQKQRDQSAERTEILKGSPAAELKKDGNRRYCKWCSKYKPDRCHHCRVCKSCILKMDHHCPWIYNCVGFKNHKYFFLLLFYSVIDCQLIMWGMLESVKMSVDIQTPFGTMFLLLFAETLAWFLGLLVTAFFGFHIWLMLKAMTTIEFCEKSMGNGPKAPAYVEGRYDFGFCGNIRAVVGDNFVFWLLPLWPPSGDGLEYMTERNRLLPQK